MKDQRETGSSDQRSRKAVIALVGGLGSGLAIGVAVGATMWSIAEGLALGLALGAGGGGVLAALFYGGDLE